MPNEYRSISQKMARDHIGEPETFAGGAYITRNGVAQLFVQPIEERAAELAQQEAERQNVALLKMALLAKQDKETGKTMSVDDALEKLRSARK